MEIAIDPTIHSFTLSSTNPIYTLNLTNESTLFKLKKKNSMTKEPVAGAEYTVYDSNKNSVCVIKTDTKGEGECTNLSSGSYTIKETKSPSGFALSSKTYTFTLSYEHPEYVLEVEDKPVLFKIKKTDTRTGENVKDAEYTVYDSESKVVCTIKTNEKGEGECRNLTSGSYSIRETKSPFNYNIDNKTYNFVLDENNPEYILNLKDEKIYGKVSLLKVV